MEALPDLASLSDDDLKQLIEELKREENEVSYRRRILHGKIDILKAELVARLQKTGGRSVSSRSTSSRCRRSSQEGRRRRREPALARLVTPPSRTENVSAATAAET